MSTDARQEWREWHERRVAAVSGPYGPLAVTGTHWLDDRPDGRIEGLPGLWTAEGDEVVLRAAAEDGLAVDGAPAAGGPPLPDRRGRYTHRLGPDGGPETTRVTWGARHLLVLRREGRWAVRAHDPDAAARRGFAGIVDFNRTLLPPCAFADHFLCPFPPPGNTLPFALRAGERNRIDH
ncbi:DUF1684 domain-containing protein [Streptomyces lydicus]|uniref:DUF1684 domain-containing protein n=1 Tax=Streptomyces lydicus TaxID=47763 RepID=UPI00343B38B2